MGRGDGCAPCGRPLEVPGRRSTRGRAGWCGLRAGPDAHRTAFSRAGRVAQAARQVRPDRRSRRIRLMKRKSLSLHWELMYTRSLFHTDDMAEQGRILDEAANLVDAGVLRTTMRENAGVINAANLRKAHA